MTYKAEIEIDTHNFDVTLNSNGDVEVAGRWSTEFEKTEVVFNNGKVKSFKGFEEKDSLLVDVSYEYLEDGNVKATASYLDTNEKETLVIPAEDITESLKTEIAAAKKAISRAPSEYRQSVSSEEIAR